jgi:hypothetical protein
MRSDIMPLVHQQHRIPEAIRALDRLPCDYVDVFTATANDATDVPPEEWARATIEGASAAGRFMAWQAILGLRLDKRPAPDHIAGWMIAERGDTWIRLEASSWSMTANMIFQIAEETVSFATLIRYDRPVAAFVWTPVSAIHRRLAPDFLGHGVRRINRRR